MIRSISSMVTVPEISLRYIDPGDALICRVIRIKFAI